MSSVHPAATAAKHLDHDDDPTLITAFRPDGSSIDGALLAVDDLGSLIDFGELGKLAFNAEGWSADRELCLCPEVNPVSRVRAVLGAADVLELLRPLIPATDAATLELLAAHASGDESPELAERVRLRLHDLGPAILEHASPAVTAAGWALITVLADLRDDLPMLARVAEWAILDLAGAIASTNGGAS